MSEVYEITTEGWLHPDDPSHPFFESTSWSTFLPLTTALQESSLPAVRPINRCSGSFSPTCHEAKADRYVIHPPSPTDSQLGFLIYGIGINDSLGQRRPGQQTPLWSQDPGHIWSPDYLLHAEPRHEGLAAIGLWTTVHHWQAPSGFASSLL